MADRVPLVDEVHVRQQGMFFRIMSRLVDDGEEPLGVFGFGCGTLGPAGDTIIVAHHTMTAHGD